ncbi:MAG: DUF3471 domain-containing protein [Cytophagaceae bacterium]|nr:MAG: DUF3471 domain-containing protein [Cytophagaceae bacterium]
MLAIEELRRASPYAGRTRPGNRVRWLVGQVLPYRGSTYAVRWKARSLNADAFATFTLDDQGRAASIKMKPILPATDFSYGFQGLALQRVE